MLCGGSRCEVSVPSKRRVETASSCAGEQIKRRGWRAGELNGRRAIRFGRAAQRARSQDSNANSAIRTLTIRELNRKIKTQSGFFVLLNKLFEIINKQQSPLKRVGETFGKNKRLRDVRLFA